MKNYKFIMVKALCVLLFFALVFSLTSCDGVVSDERNGDTTTVEESSGQITEKAEEDTEAETEVQETEVLESLQNLDSALYNQSKAATAFINKDTKTLEELLGCREGVLKQYEDFSFGKYSFYLDNAKLKMIVEITDSSLEDVPPGEYTVLFSSGHFGEVGMEGLGTYSRIEAEEEFADIPAQYIKRWISFTGKWDFSFAEDMGELPDGFKERYIFYLNIYADDMESVEDYRKAAYDMFGVENLIIPESVLEEDGSVTDLWGFGGSVRVYKKLSEETDFETGITTIYVQTYADFFGTVRSHIYEYKFKDCGTYYKHISSGLFKESEYEPEDRYAS